MKVTTKDVVTAQRGRLSFMSRMVLSRSSLSEEAGGFVLYVDSEVADLMPIERVSLEIQEAIQAELGSVPQIRYPQGKKD